jgi:hypothetical protein
VKLTPGVQKKGKGIFFFSVIVLNSSVTEPEIDSFIFCLQLQKQP